MGFRKNQGQQLPPFHGGGFSREPLSRTVGLPQF
jgi:hypothetical protein